MKNAMNSIQIKAPSTNAFDLSHDVKLSCNMGDLIPVLAMECVPGDRVRIGCENLTRLAPMLAPMMHRVDVRVEYFFVPNRLLWENWETWITNGGDQPTQVNPLPVHPKLKYNLDGSGGNVAYTKLMNYMGIPRPDQCPEPLQQSIVSALPFGAYQLIWDEYYRDENLQDKISAGDWPLNDGFQTNFELFNIRQRCWEADYFTKSLPFAQKGQPVDIPLAEFNDVRVNRVSIPGGPVSVWNTTVPGGGDQIVIDNLTPPNPAPGISSLYAETSDLVAAAPTINDLRLAFRLQEWLEKNARGGTRYSELIRSHFNVNPQDARLQRPEYIVGVKNPIQVSEVLNTTGTETNPQGTMAGHGVSYTHGNYGKYFVQEHGYVIGIMSIMPKTCYQQGIPRHFLKFDDPTQLAWPTFANLGEQEIQEQEIMAQSDDPTSTWGYMPRYMEYKTLPSRVCGEFQTTLDFWHMGRIFDPAARTPALNANFVKANPTKRIFAVEDPDQDSLWCQVMHHIVCIRPLPVYGTPTI